VSTSPPTTVPPLDGTDAPAPPPAAPTLAGQPSGGRAATTDAALLTGGTYIAQGLQFVAGLMQKAILGPVGAGYWALMQTFWTFFSMAPLGAQHGATRQIPVQRGQGDYAGAARSAGTGATFGLVAMTTVGALLALVAIVFGSGWAPEMRFGLVLLGVTAPLRYASDVHEIIIQAVKRFDIASATVLVKAVAMLVLQTAAVWALGFYGLFLGLVAIELAAFALWLRVGVISRTLPAFRLGIDRERLRDLISFGAPIMIYAQVWLLFLAVDSLIVASALDVRQLGLYALAVSVTNYVLYLPKTVGSVLFPRMAERFGQTGELASIQRYATETQRLMAYMLVPIAVGIGFFAFPVVIRHALPAFLHAIDVVQIMIAASFFMALMNMPIKVLLTAGYRWSLTALVLGCVAINAALNYVALVVLDEGIEAAATATAISYFLTFVATTGYGLSRTYGWRQVLLHIGEVVVVFVYVYAALRLIHSAVDVDDPGLVADAAIALGQLAVFMVALVPWLVLAERRLGGVSMLRGLAEGALRRRRR
jgi:O-antigen/teichoic acid export membrane protein